MSDGTRHAIVTGPTGAIGMALIELLLGKNYKVTAVVNPRSARADRIVPSAVLDAVPLELSRISSLPRLVDGPADLFFHLAWTGASGKRRDDPKLQANNALYAVEAARAAAKLGVKSFVGAGSQAEYGPSDDSLTEQTPCKPITAYGAAKLSAGQLTSIACKQAGVKHNWPRILSVYGPHDGKNAMLPYLLGQLADGCTAHLSSCEQTWDYLYAKDAAEALLAIALHGTDGVPYVVSSGQSRHLKEYVDEAVMAMGGGDVMFGNETGQSLSGDPSRLMADTGWSPATDFADGIRETAMHVRKEMGLD